MKNTIKISAIAFFTIATLSTSAMSASMTDMMETSKARLSCKSSCNSDYAACVGSATDLSLTSSAGDIIPRTKSNLMAGKECNGAVLQCYSDC